MYSSIVFSYIIGVVVINRSWCFIFNLVYVLYNRMLFLIFENCLFFYSM